jgi:hypothetical protein
MIWSSVRPPKSTDSFSMRDFQSSSVVGKFSGFIRRDFSRQALSFLLLTCVAAVAHAQERQCPPDDTLCVAEVAAARLSAANARITSLTQINADQKAIIDAKDQLIAVKDQIIANLKQMDTNSQRIDVLGTEKEAIWKEQHRDDKEMIADLTKDLASCRSNQKFVFAGGAILGGAIAWKVKGNNGALQNPFGSNGLTFTSPEERARIAMKGFLK